MGKPVIAQTTFLSLGAVGTQDVTIAGFGTPTAVIVLGIKSGTTSEDIGTAYDGASFNIGFFDGTNARVAATEGKHGATGGDGSRSMVEGVIDQVVTSADPILSIGTATAAFITDGVRLTWSGSGPEVHRYILILIRGLANVVVGDAIGVNSNNLGFRPDVIFVATPGINYPERVDASVLSFGCVVDDGSNTERSLQMSCADGPSPTANTLILDTSDSVGQVYNGAQNWAGNLTIDADGFDTNTLDVDEIIYLALQFDADVSFSLGTYAIPTATGAASISGLGFQPGFLMLALSNVNVADTVRAADVYGFGIGFAVGDDEYFVGEAEEDAVNPSNTQSKITATIVDLPHDDGTQLAVASFTSFDAGGFTLNYSTAPAAARYGWYLAIEADQPSSGIAILRRRRQ